MQIIDAHQHFWKYHSDSHGWIDEKMKVIRRDFMPEDLAKVYKKNGVAGCVAVQADQTEDETLFLLDLAEKHDFIKGVVGWVDLRSENLEGRLQHFSKYPKLKGFRHIVQGEADHNFLLRPAFLNGISMLAKYNFTYDILVFPHQLGAVLEFVKKFPHQKFVIDHLAKPYIKDGFIDGWATMMRAIAQNENVFCKVSGIVTEADYQNWTYEQIVPYLEVVFEAFGTDRLMFGSDWPVCLVAAQYWEMMDIVKKYIAEFSASEQEKIWNGNAIQFYNLNP